MKGLAYHDDVRISLEVEQHGGMLLLVLGRNMEQVGRLLIFVPVGRLLIFIPVVGESGHLQVRLVILLHGGGIIKLLHGHVLHLVYGLTGVALATLEKSLELPGLITTSGLGGLLHQPGFPPVNYDTGRKQFRESEAEAAETYLVRRCPRAK